jgi:hypothetical protein
MILPVISLGDFTILVSELQERFYGFFQRDSAAFLAIADRSSLPRLLIDQQ